MYCGVGEVRDCSGECLSSWCSSRTISERIQSADALSRFVDTDGNFWNPPDKLRKLSFVGRELNRLPWYIALDVLPLSVGTCGSLPRDEAACALLRLSFEEQTRGECRPTGRQVVTAAVAQLVG